ncbi:nucleotidyltransferase domain-containing protein [Amycolatopsis anabasis]|uniref:nucleotidyltransferase domain-containing protein n=1 Tax=Amycolatopsis anabasis TaxID=1840409 RepID=UPI0015D2AF1A|nr:nucleotidyltransferase domain-containing protein [Amycolatopsis anabasis]
MRSTDADPRPEERDAVARDLRVALEDACPGSRTEPRGSLARGTADAYSDIDLAWLVPGERFSRCVDRAAAAVDAVHPVELVRADPDFRHSANRRLLFFSFRDLPLFWRLDLEISTASGAGDAAEPGADWSRPASALANAVGTVKAVRRGRFTEASGLLDRGFQRIGADDRATGDWPGDIVRLTRAAARRDPALRAWAERIARLGADLR